MAEGAATNTDSGDRSGWSIDDSVVRLRPWGAGDDAAYILVTGRRLVLGSSSDCDICVHDSRGRISRHHAEILEDGGKLVIRDLGSTNGIRLDGELRLSFHLTPAIEIGIASERLIAESPRSIAVHALLGRALGWSPSRRADVDTALLAVRGMAALRAPLLFRGVGLSRVARRLHEHTLPELPFVDTTSDVDLDPVRARGGTIFVDIEASKVDLRKLAATSRAPGSRVRTIVAAASPDAVTEATSLFPGIVPVLVPPLSRRRHELRLLMDEFAADAIARWDLPSSRLQPEDEERVARLELDSLEDLEELIERTVSARNGGVTIGAARIGITYVSLGRWLRARGMPIDSQ